MLLAQVGAAEYEFASIWRQAEEQCWKRMIIAEVLRTARSAVEQISGAQKRLGESSSVAVVASASR